MQMIARIRLTVEVPFDFDIQPPDETGESPSRVEAAQHAESDVVNTIKATLPADATVVDELLEEVREADEAA